MITHSAFSLPVIEDFLDFLEGNGRHTRELAQIAVGIMVERRCDPTGDVD
jgi:hypothetical protein